MKNLSTFNCRLVACDLDGTLCGSDRDISEENMEGIRLLCEHGIEFVPTTGRAFYEMPELIRECPYIRYYITSNGSAVIDKAANRHYTFGIPRTRVKRILDIFDDYTTYIMLHAYGNSHVDLSKDTDDYYHKCGMDCGWINYIRTSDVFHDDFDTFSRSIDEAEMMCVFVAGKEMRNECAERLISLGDLTVTCSDSQNVEVFSKRAGKGNSMLALAHHIGAADSETVALGDSMNDLSMIKAAEVGIAMKNACPGLKSEADIVTEYDNDSHVIAHLAKILPIPSKGGRDNAST